jgi:flagellar basal-body rod protein FlgC
MIQLITGIQNSSAALDAENTRLNVISENIANANTTHGPDGKPYQRQVVTFESALQQAGDGSGMQTPAMTVAQISKDTRPPIQIYDPGSPDADKTGMVSLPNINIHEEMADMISASRSYEANLAVIKNSRSMAMQTLAISKH